MSINVKDVIGALRVPLPGERYRKELNMRGPPFAIDKSAVAMITASVCLFVVLNLPSTWRFLLGWLGAGQGDEL